MIKLAGKVIDSYDDPKFVGLASLGSDALPDSAAIGQLPDRDFAVIIKTAAGTNRKYPTSTPELTKISSAYFNEYGHQLPDDARGTAARFLKKASEVHGIPITITYKSSGATTNCLTYGEDFDVDIDIQLGKEASDRRAEGEFLAYYGRMTPVERALAANDMHKVADIQDSRVFDYVIKPSFGPNMRDGVRDRMTLLQGDTIKVASLKQVLVRMNDSDVGRAAVLLHQFDKLAGYEGRVKDAFLTCWGGVVKIADKRSDDEIMEYKIDTLARAHGQEVRRVFSDDIADAFTRDPVGYYKNRAEGQVKTMLKYLANQVAKKSANSEIRKDQVKGAKEAIRSGEYTPWSKTLTEMRSV